MSEKAFPVQVTSDDDPRFTFGLVVEVAEVLARRGFPDATVGSGADFVALRQALFRFLYSSERW